jgi:hypothetical protein
MIRENGLTGPAMPAEWVMAMFLTRDPAARESLHCRLIANPSASPGDYERLS